MRNRKKHHALASVVIVAITSICNVASDQQFLGGPSAGMGGADYRISRQISAQIGLGTKSGMSAGVGIYGIHLAIGNRFPFQLSTTFQF